jgi:general secretion pathway protein L
MSSLFLLLPAPAAGATSEYAYVQSSDGQHVQHSGQAAASMLASAGRADAVVAVVAWQMLSWHRVALPPGLNPHSRRQQPRVRAALEGLLEEKLLDDPQSLHMALAPRAHPSESCWVAVCDRQWLRGHLQHLEASGHAVARLVPELAPTAEARLWALGDAGQPWLLASGMDGLASLASLPLKGDAALIAALLAALPADTAVQAEPQLTHLMEGSQAWNRPVEIQPLAQRLLAAGRSPWDLAQFEFDLGTHTRWRRRLQEAWQSFSRAPQWRAARWGAALAVAAQLVGLNAWAWKENRAIAQRQQQAVQTLKETFPHIPVVVDAPVQMQRELDLLRSASGALSSADLEPLLAASARIPGIQAATGLQYQERQLRIQGLALDGQALADAQQSLAGSGLRLERSGNDWVLQAEASL